MFSRASFEMIPCGARISDFLDRFRLIRWSESDPCARVFIQGEQIPLRRLTHTAYQSVSSIEGSLFSQPDRQLPSVDRMHFLTMRRPAL